ncbi:MAG: hypothetical protein ACXW0Q_06575 [Methylovulum sp.]
MLMLNSLLIEVNILLQLMLIHLIEGILSKQGIPSLSADAATLE